MAFVVIALIDYPFPVIITGLSVSCQDTCGTWGKCRFLTILALGVRIGPGWVVAVSGPSHYGAVDDANMSLTTG